MDTLSRLKGIETFYGWGYQMNVPNALDTLSRLKGIETLFKINPILAAIYTPLDTLSRLKGIETAPWHALIRPDTYFGSAFPFEGN